MGPDKDEQRDAQEQTSQSASYSAATLHVTGCEKNVGTWNSTFAHDELVQTAES